MAKQDRSAAKTSPGHFQFVPLRPQGDGTPLSALSLDDDEELIVFERGGQERGLVLRQMAYHHVAQGALAGIPYLVTF